MSTERIRRTMVEVIEETCETLAFVFAMPPPDDGPDLDGERQQEPLRVRVHFEGHSVGSLTMTLPEEMLFAVAANMLGLEEAATSLSERADAACELCNVICGNLLPALVGNEALFDVASPQIVEDAPTPDADDRLSARAWFDEGWVEAQLALDRGLSLLTCPEAAGPLGSLA